MSGRKPTFLLRKSLLHLKPASMALDIEQIRQTADRVAASHGLEVVDIEYLGGSKHRMLRVFIEQNAEQRAHRAQQASEQDSLEHLGAGGIPLDQLAWVTHEDCEQFSRDFGTVIDVENLVPVDGYTLEVSSPGLDRKLTRRGDFERFQASPVKVQTFTPIAGNRHWRGKLTEVKAEGIVLDLTPGKHKGSKKSPPPVQRVEIAFANIEKAHLAPEI
jgi:ribosome maturation factor RimP